MGRAFEFRKARKMKRWSAMAKTFTRIGKDIAMSVRDGGPNPETNSRLRAVIQNAKAANMPKDNIERAIKRASDKSTENYKEVLLRVMDHTGLRFWSKLQQTITIELLPISVAILISAMEISLNLVRWSLYLTTLVIFEFRPTD